MHPYCYNCVDNSILLPVLKKNVFSVLHRWIPYGIPANFLTLVSIIIMWAVFFHFTIIEEINNTDVLLAVVSLLLYVLFDHFDGLQAKATKTSSPLGELLDHFSDVFNGALVVYLCFRVVQIELAWIFYTVLWFNYLAFAVTYVEQSLRNELYFGKIGSLEGIVLVLAVMMSCIHPNGASYWHASLFSGLPNYMVLLLGFLVGSVYTLAGSLRRIGYVPKHFIHFIISGSLLYLMCLYYDFSWSVPFLVLTAYSGEFILKAMHTYFFEDSSRSPDSMLYVFLATVLLFEFFSLGTKDLFLIYGLLVIVKMLWMGYSIFSELKTYWVWWNVR